MPAPEWMQIGDWAVDQFGEVYGAFHPTTRIQRVAGGGLVVGETYYPPAISNSNSMLGLLLVGGLVLWAVTRK